MCIGIHTYKIDLIIVIYKKITAAKLFRVVATRGGTHFAAPSLSITAYIIYIIIRTEIIGENESYE